MARIENLNVNALKQDLATLVENASKDEKFVVFEVFNYRAHKGRRLLTESDERPEASQLSY